MTSAEDALRRELHRLAPNSIRPGLDRIRSRTAAPSEVEAAATATDCEESTAMSTISGAHEEVSIYGTGIVHVPLIGRPEFAGLTFDAGGTATATVKDGALALATDDIDLLLAWRNAFQTAISAMNIRQQRSEGRS